MTLDIPNLLKARQLHSRLFAAALIALAAVSESRLPRESLAHWAMVWTGFSLVIVCVLGRSYCSAFIGGRKNDEVVRQGPFSVVRNPLYVCSFLGTVGVGLQSGMALFMLALAVAFMVYYPAVVAREEAFLRHKFGAPYEAYLAEVPRWIPNLKLWREPDAVECKPRFLRRTMLDASVFFLALPAFELLRALHAQSIVPLWFRLP